MFSHGIIAGFDSALRAAWYSGAKYPLSAALYASSTLKSRLNARIRVNGEMRVRRIRGASHGTDQVKATELSGWDVRVIVDGETGELKDVKLISK